MNTLQFDRKMKHEPGFLGAHPFDMLPKSRRRHFSLIINTASSRESGDHWLGLVYVDGVFYFMDSFGRNYNHFTFSMQFRNAIRKYIGNNKCRFNKDMSQSLTSEYCGFYAIFYVKMLNRNKTLRIISSYFTTNTRLNDKNIVEYVNMLM